VAHDRCWRASPPNRFPGPVTAQVRQVREDRSPLAVDGAKRHRHSDHMVEEGTTRRTVAFPPASTGAVGRGPTTRGPAFMAPARRSGRSGWGARIRLMPPAPHVYVDE